MTSKASSQPRSNTGLPRSSPNMANTDTPDQALRDLRLNGGVSSSIHDPASQTTTPAGGASDDASVASSSRPRKHRRGGRKKKTRMAPTTVEETRLPWSERLDEGMSGLEDGHVGQINGKEVKETPNADDVSENVSAASSSQPRRHKRGGRKKKSHMAPVNEAEARVPWSERVGRLGGELGGSGKEKARAVDEEQSLEKEKGKGKGKEEPVGGEQNPVQEEERMSDTGVRAFNIRRTQGGKPFGISIDRDGDAEGQGKKSEEENGEEEGRKEEKKKPVSIRLDLNLEIEIFLKAKIKGDVTITFLE